MRDFRLIRMLATAIGLQGILILVASGRPEVCRDKLGAYIRQHKRAFIIAASFGAAATLIIFPWLQATSFVRRALGFRDERKILGILLALFAALVVTWPNLRNFWTRSRNTWAFHNPPLQYLHLIFIFTASAGLAIAWQALPPTSTQFRTLAVLGAFAISAWMVSAWIFSQTPQTVPQRDSTDLFLLSDEPISVEADDRLHRTAFVESLYRQITALPFSDSFVIGLNGPWGSGKTSVLRMLARRLAESPAVITLEFNPWLYASEPALIDGFYSAIERTLVREYTLSDLRRQLFRYSNLLSFGLGSERFGFRLRMPLDPEYLRKRVESFIEQTYRRFVVVIDDIDRLHHRELLALFKLVRFSTRFRRTVFLLSFDNFVVSKALEKQAVDPEFVDKIVQMQVDIPPAEQSDIDNFILFTKSESDAPRSAIDHVLDAIKLDPATRKRFDDEFVPFYLTTLSKVIRTIRQAKRFVNAVSATLPAVIGEVNEFDFCLLTAIRLSYPGVYRDLWENRYFYVPPAEIQTARSITEHIKREEYAKGAKERILGLVKTETADDAEADSLLGILKQLFGQVKWALDGPLVSGRGPERDREQKRVNAPECFDRYFLLRGLTGEISDQEVETLIANWNAVEPTAMRASVYSSLADFRERKQLSQLLRKLFVFWHALKPTLVRPAAVALAQSVGLFSQEAGEEGWQSENNLALLLILQLVNGERDQSEIQSTLLEVLSAVDDQHLPFGVQLVESCGQTESLDQIRNHADVTELRTRQRGRLRDYYIEGGGDLFSLPDRDWIYIAYQWGVHFDLPGAKQEVSDLLIRQFERQPQFIGRFLQGFFKREDNVHQLYGSFATLIEPIKILEFLDKYGSQATTGTDQRIVEGFREFCKPPK